MLLLPTPQEINSWPDFKSQVGSLPKKGKGDAFEAFVLAFLKLDPQYTTLLQDVWLLRNVPTDVRSHLKLPDRDEGIDLIARTFEGTYWAIQCKYVEDEDRSLSRKALSTFTDLAFTVCRNIDYALICTTADRYSHKLTLYGERLGFLAGETWRNLDNDFFAALNQYLQGQKVSFAPRSPRPHQQRAIDNAESHFVTEGNSRGKLILPCGTGKSLTGYWIAERLRARTILVAVPSLVLVRQTLKEWLRETVAREHAVRWIAVCSDESVADQKREDVAIFTQDLGIRVHTDPQEIATWLQGDHDGLTVVFTTYQSGKATSEAARLARITFDLAIMDEAHKTVGKKDSLFSHLLFDENVAVRHRVFMTATERRYLGNSDQIASMTDPDLYGETFELLSFKEALEADPPILSDYKIVTIVVTRAEIRELVKENLFVRPDRGRWDDDVEAEMLAAAIALRKAIRKHPIRHAVSFHGSIARAKVCKATQDALSTSFPDFGSLETFHVSGSTPTAKRSKELERFVAAAPSLVTNARCLTEGVDVPDIDCVLFADPKRSTVDIVQAVGRALRRAEGKEFGYVIVPVLIDGDLGDDPEAQYEAFAPVLTVLRSLAGNDERIVEYFRSVSEGRKRTGRGGGEIIEIPDGVFVDTNAFVESIELKFWSRLAKLSWRPFEEAREFARGLNFSGKQEWSDFCKGGLPNKGTLPQDIPSKPERTYQARGWLGWGDWLGTGTISPSLRAYRPFAEAREFVHTICLSGANEWRQFCRGKIPEKGTLPPDIPACPYKTYEKTGWSSWGDWLGTGSIATYQQEFRPFSEARDFVHSLGLKSQSEWFSYCKGKFPEKNAKPDDIPYSPDNVYKNKGWTTWGDWLGTGRMASQYLKFIPYEQAREFARKLNLRNQDEWKSFCVGKMPEKGTLPDDIPVGVAITYKGKGWLGWGDFLGTGNISVVEKSKRYRSFEETRAFVRSLNLKSKAQWRDYCQGNLPEKAMAPFDLPTNPSRTYANDGWSGWGDWLGTGTVAPFMLEYRSFSEAREFARSLHLKTRNEWQLFCQGKMPEKGTLPKDIPATPERTYAGKGWISVGDWLGTNSRRVARSRKFEDAREYARILGLKTQNEWKLFCKGMLPDREVPPEDIPTSPDYVYKNMGWGGWPDWLGTEDK